MNGDAPANGANGSAEWWKEPPPPLPAAQRSRSRLRKYLIPGGRSQRGLAVLRRAAVLKPRSKEQQRCSMCWRRRCLGRSWAPPSAEPSAEERLWYCEPCWFRWRVAVKQWFVSKQSTWDDWDLRPERRRKRSEGAGPGGPVASGGEEAAPDTPSSPLLGCSTGPGAEKPEHFDFVEVGTSNYHTFTQAVAGHPDGKPYAWKFLPWDRHPFRLRGLAVDMKRSYLDQLPDLPRIAKVQAAVSESGGTQQMYHVPLGDIEHFEAVFAQRGSWRGHRAMRLARGCSSLGRHRMLKGVLAAIGLRHLARVRRVRTCSLAAVLRRNRVGSIGMLALDCEGHDCMILRGLLRACGSKPSWYPRFIWFESNGMNDELFGQGTEQDTVRELRRHGYRLLWGGGYALTGKRDTLLQRRGRRHDSRKIQPCPCHGDNGACMVPSFFGNPACWVGDLRFLPCCSVSAFGQEGNPACWDEELGTSFQRCCIDRPADGPDFQEQIDETLRRAEADFRPAVNAFAELVHRLDHERHALGARPLRLAEAHLLTDLSSLVRQWRSGQLNQLASRLPAALAAYERGVPRPGPPSPSPRVAVLTACTASSAGSEVCRLGASLWQCYAQRHGYHFIYDSNPYPSYPLKFRFDGWIPKGLVDAVDADFDENDTEFLYQEPLSLDIGSDALDFKWWQRWYAARRHLAAYDLLLVVDPDTAIFPSCNGVGLLEAFGLPEDREAWPGVIARDPREGEDLNGGVFALAGNAWGFLFLELLLARSRWPIDVAGGGGWCHARQSAEYETLLEVIALGRMFTSDSPIDYTSECMQHAVLQVFEKGENTYAGCIWPMYLACWRKVVNRLLGPHGHRSVSPVWLLDPAKVDINYRPWSNEPRYRDPYIKGKESPLPPLANAAFLWHYVAIPKKVENMLRDFGLSSLEDTYDCQWLQRHYEQGVGSLFPQCGLGGSRVPCPFEDSLLMPHEFGC